MQIIKKVLSILSTKERKECIVLVIMMIMGAIMETVGIGVIMPLIAMMGNENFLLKYPLLQELYQNVGANSHSEVIVTTTVALIIFYLFKNAFMIFLTRKQVKFSFDKQNSTAKLLLAYYLQQPYLFHLDRNSATLIRNITTSIHSIFAVLVVNIFMLITECFVVLMVWLMLVLVDAFTATVVAGILGSLIYLLIKTIKNNLAKQGKILQASGGEYIKWLNQALNSVKETKVLCKEKFFLEEFAENYQKYNNANFTYIFMNNLPRFSIETVVMLGMLMMIIYKIATNVNPTTIVPLLGLLAFSAFRLMPSANRIVNMYNSFSFYVPVFDLLYEDFMAIKNKDVLAELEYSSSKFIFDKELVVNNLSFTYPSNVEQIVLDEVSFSIEKGSFVGIVGVSGAGKTTFVDILLGLLEPTTGNIYVDGVDIFSEIRSWQKKMAYVPQSIYLVDGTISENIALGERAEQIDPEKVKKALAMAELLDFVNELPDGIKSTVGERGVKLSGGQRQRIGIARALYLNPEVLILDEATSALDTETEGAITDTILKLKGEITIIAIAHRLTTLEKCDFKIKFDDGKVEVLKESV